ncbi:MAG TPA: peptide-methionine (S)-S-oxide reductase, partial [Flavobacteriales bacterium]|nr:peptide-methionine (S)-S-oxide reductase [Flavobacteriales bacterium]
MDTITLGAGCFWCVEAIFRQLEGVQSVVSGYSGGQVKNPSYREVCNGTTGHAEVCQLVYDPNVISLENILEVFFQTHDPTTLNRQGADVGTQYRSAIFYHTEDQRQVAESVKEDLIKADVWSNPV